MIILIGASASGKTEIAKELKKSFGIVKAITTTTRPIRKGEIDGVDYFFIDKERFIELKEQDHFIETTLYNGNYYGCGKDQISDDKVIIVDPEGLKSFISLNEDNIVSFYTKADEDVRIKRMTGRGDDPLVIDQRIKNDITSFSSKNIGKVDHIIDTNKKSVESLAKDIYRKYIAKISAF